MLGLRMFWIHSNSDEPKVQHVLCHCYAAIIFINIFNIFIKIFNILIIFLHQSRQGPSPSIAQFGWATSSWKSPSFAKLLPFENYGRHCTRNRQCSSAAELIFVALRRSVPLCNPVSELCRQFFWPHGLVFTLIFIVSCEAFYREVCAFPNHVQSI